MRKTRLLTCLMFILPLLPQATAQQSVSRPLDNAAGRALKALRDEDVGKALEALGEAADTVLPPDNRFEAPLSSAAGGLYRALAQLGTDEQYELLHDWSFPVGDRKAFRVLTTLVPEEAPPNEFARALGSRPKKDSFAIASVGEMPGIFCSAWTLVVAADAEGRLARLITELEDLSGQSVPNADFVLILARVRSDGSDDTALLKFMEDRINESGDVPSPAERSDTVLAAAALQRSSLAQSAEKLAERLNTFDLTGGTSNFVPFLRRVRAHTILKNRSPETAANDLFYTTPALWVAADDQNRPPAPTGTGKGSWLTHEDHVKRLAGPGDDTLLFRYPLTGTFELKGEVAELEHGGGGLTYGGMAFDANSAAFTLQEVQRPHSERRVWPFVAPKEHRMFNRVNIRCDGETVTFLSNLHPGWKGTVADCASCPWLGLRAFGHGRIIFRNLELVGEPTIPRQVQISGQNDLRGWASTYGQATPKIVTPFPTVEATPSDVVPVWTNNEGVIEGSLASTDSETAEQNHLAYMRPCLPGETITYEFFYEENKVAAHPALGRVAFLLNPTGVELHWLTDNVGEWTGLPEDNTIVEPLSRRGPRNLPLKDNDWNAVSLKITDGKVLLSLNEQEIYERSLEDFPGTHFGIYHNRNATSARVRDVVLSGDWPEKLSREQLDKLVAFE